MRFSASRVSKYDDGVVDNRRLIREEQRVYESRVEGKLSRKRKRFRLIDVFAGAGGMTLGFSNSFGHAFDSVWANDFDDSCVETYNANFGKHCVPGDIVDILNHPGTHIPRAEVVIGGPPCQGFSLLNKKREGDPRKQLWRPFFDVVQRSGSKIFVMENVPQLLGSFEHGEIMGTAEAMGFKVGGCVVRGRLRRTADTTPRDHYRVQVLRSETCVSSTQTHFDPSKGAQTSFLLGNGNGYVPSAIRWRTVRETIADLPPPVGTEIRDEAPPLDLHFGRTPTSMSLARYKAIPIEGMNRFDLQRRAFELTPDCWIRKTSGGTDLFGRLWWDRNYPCSGSGCRQMSRLR